MRCEREEEATGRLGSGGGLGVMRKDGLDVDVVDEGWDEEPVEAREARMAA